MMIRQDQGNTFARQSEMFPYLPFHKNILHQSYTLSNEKTFMTSSFKGSILPPDRSQRNTSPHHQPIEKLNLPRLDDNTPRRRNAGGPMIRQMDGLTATLHEAVNPEIAPYKSQDFMSSTVMKNMPISKRHLDTFSTLENLFSGKRGIALHTHRYNWDTSRSLDSMSQRERLLLEIESLERLRDIRRKTEILPHRLPLDMSMGGKRLDIEERFDINRELRRLKAMVLPQYAKDLYHGRGINLPSNHASIKPRKAPIPDNDEFVTNSAPSLRRQIPKYAFGSETSKLQHQGSFNQKEKLPKINRHSNLGFDLDSSLSCSNTNVLPSLHRNPASWVEEQNQHIKERQEDGMIEKESVDVTIPEERSNTDVVTPVAPPPTAGAPSHTPYSPVTPLKSITPYPLKGSELMSQFPEDKKQALKETFKKLDTDDDGHLKFTQLRPALPPEFSPQQENFIKQVYDITSSSTFFGIDEFLTMSQLGECIKELSEDATDAYKILDEVDVKKCITQYVELFQSVDRNQSGKLSQSSLREILSIVLETDIESDSTLWNKIVDTVNMVKPDQITKIEFLAHLPYFYQLGTKS